MRINKIHVRNFKSLYDTKFEPGNVNVLIGANGSGKSSVLEALGILSAAMSDRVNDNSLQRMGVRLSPSPMYKSRFKTIDRIPAAIEFQIEWTDTDKDGAQVKCLYKADMLPLYLQLPVIHGGICQKRLIRTGKELQGEVTERRRLSQTMSDILCFLKTCRISNAE